MGCWRARTSQTPAGTRAASRRSARVGFSRDAAARYANFRRSAATEARRVRSAPPVARRPTLAVHSCVWSVAQLAPGVPSVQSQTGVFPAAGRAPATVIVMSRVGPPRRSASWCPFLSPPWASVREADERTTNFRYNLGGKMRTLSTSAAAARHPRVENQQAHRAHLGAHLLDMRCAAGSWLAERRSPMTPAKKGGKWDGLPASEG